MHLEDLLVDAQLLSVHEVPLVVASQLAVELLVADEAALLRAVRLSRLTSFEVNGRMRLSSRLASAFASSARLDRAGLTVFCALAIRL